MNDDSGNSAASAPAPRLALPKAGKANWFDGSGKEKRVKVKRIVDLGEPTLPDRPANLPDPGEVDEIHREVRKALNEEDDRKLGKLFEDVLDAAHKSDSTPEEQKTPDFERCVVEFEAAFKAELLEFTRQKKGWGAAYEITSRPAEALRAAFKTPEGDLFQASCDERALKRALVRNNWEPRAAAVDIVEKFIHEVAVARASA